MSMEERTVTETSLYDGAIIHLKKLSVQLPDGRLAQREVIYHPGAVAILAEPEPGSIVFVQQFRKPVEQTLLELPAGKLEVGENAADAALRELREETGYVATRIEPVFSFYTSPGFANEKVHLYYATGLAQGDADPDDGEFVDVMVYQKAEIAELLRTGQIEDAKTLIGLLWWMNGCKHKEGNVGE